jgi:hypothetical protein
MGIGYDSMTTDSNFWRIDFGLPAIFCIIRTFNLLTIFNDEPPGYYVSEGDESKAVEVLEKIY